MSAGETTKRFYGPYRATFAVEMSFRGPWHVGSGELAEKSDDPLLKDEVGKPYIPGSSLRGVMRDFCEREASLYELPAGLISSLFGPRAVVSGTGGSDRKGRLTFFDAFPSGTPSTEVVKFNRHDPATGATFDGGLFDVEAARCEKIVWEMQYDGDSKKDPELFLLCETLLLLQNADIFSFGAKGAAGFGMPDSLNVTVRTVDRSTKDGFAAWMRERLPAAAAATYCPAVAGVPDQKSPQTASIKDFVNSGGLWSLTDRVPAGEKIPGTEAPRTAWSWLSLDLAWQFEGPMFVEGKRKEGNGAAGEGNQKQEAKKYITIPDSETPYLPGASLRGRLRARANKIASELGVEGLSNLLFGSPPGEEAGLYRGMVSIGEGAYRRRGQEIREGEQATVDTITLHHVAIDRVTSFNADGNLFTVTALASPCFHNRVILRWNDQNEESKAAAALFIVTLIDAAEHGLRVGQATTRGYGLMSRLTVTGYSLAAIANNARCTPKSAKWDAKDAFPPRKFATILPQNLFTSWSEQVKEAMNLKATEGAPTDEQR